MAGRKLTKYEKMWRTRRHNAKLRKEAASAEARETGTAMKPDGRTREGRALKQASGIVRTSSKRLKPGTKMAPQFQVIGDRSVIDEMRAHGHRLFKEEAARGRDAPPSFPHYAADSFVIVKDSAGRGVMVNVRDVLHYADVIKQTGFVE